MGKILGFLQRKREIQIMLFITEKSTSIGYPSDFLRVIVAAEVCFCHTFAKGCNNGRISDDIRQVFDEMPDRTASSWHEIMVRNAKNGKIDKARYVFDRMRTRNPVSWNVMITGYSKVWRLEEARQLFDEMPDRNVVSWNAMISGYAQNGRIEDAQQLFARAPEKDGVTWTAMVQGYARIGRIEDACTLFDEMPERNAVSWTAMITALAQNRRLEDARRLFDRMPEPNVVSWTAMITGYVQKGRVDDARALFDKMPDRDVVAWNAMIAGYAQNGRIEDAQQLFDRMPQRNMEICHAMIVGYGQCGRTEMALKLFSKLPERNVVSWNALIAGLSQNGEVDKARELFDEMPQRNIVSWNTMVAGYAHNGRVKDARELFDRMPERDLISLNSIIAGYAQNDQGEESIILYSQIKQLGMKPDKSTLTSALNACATLAALGHGKQVHDDIIKLGLGSDVYVASALITMYSKSGCVEDAQSVFDKLPEKDVISWNSMISGYAMHGYGEEALKLFEQMLLAEMKPNDVTFVGVLSACSHVGLVDEGMHHFDSMRRDHSVIPTEYHYSCLVGLLGRAGRLDKAEEIVNNMPFEPTIRVLGALLGACRIHKNAELGKCIAYRIFQLKPQTSAPYVALSNIYASAGKWDDVINIRKMMKVKGVKKNPGWSWIEVRNKIHTFLTGDRSHPETEKIYATLEGLIKKMKETGYTPDTEFVLHDVEEEEKGQIINHHSEKLAIVFGLISTPFATPIRVIKNLRVCGDCHTAAKLISKIVKREIVVRDALRFHHFKNGSCSCGDFW